MSYDASFFNLLGLATKLGGVLIIAVYVCLFFVYRKRSGKKS